MRHLNILKAILCENEALAIKNNKSPWYQPATSSLSKAAVEVDVEPQTNLFTGDSTMSESACSETCHCETVSL
jgi:hypothetical protein